MIFYDYPAGRSLDLGVKDAERRMEYDNDFLRQCGIAPLPYSAFWAGNHPEQAHRMYVCINERKRPVLRVFVPAPEVLEGKEKGYARKDLGWVLAQEVKASRRKVKAVA